VKHPVVNKFPEASVSTTGLIFSLSFKMKKPAEVRSNAGLYAVHSIGKQLGLQYCISKTI